MSASSTAIGTTPQVVQNANHTTQDEVVVELALHRAEPQLLPASPVTEPAVVFSTTAAAAVRPTRWWTKAVRSIALVPRLIFVTAPTDSRRKQRHYPEHHGLLEDSRMEREMHRL
jgi:hypothetical protein